MPYPMRASVRLGPVRGCTQSLVFIQTILRTASVHKVTNSKSVQGQLISQNQTDSGWADACATRRREPTPGNSRQVIPFASADGQEMVSARLCVRFGHAARGSDLKAKAPVPASSARRRTIANRILSALPPEEYERILPDLKAVPLKFLISLHEPGDKMPYVYFPNTGVISTLTVLEDGSAVEIATIGNEGMADVSVYLGLERSDSWLLVQVPGTAMRMESGRFREHVEEIPILRALLGYYTVSMLALVAQSAACNRMHAMAQRCARWMLMTHDRVDAAEFPLT